MPARTGGNARVGAGATGRAPQCEAESGGADGGGGVTLVFFIGGVTFFEISAIRWLRRNAKPRRQYMVATTHIASGEQMIGSLLRPFENNLTYLDR